MRKEILFLIPLILSLYFVSALVGDVNEDNAISIDDVPILIAFLTGNAELSSTQQQNADVCADSKITIHDLRSLVHMLIGLPVSCSTMQEPTISAPTSGLLAFWHFSNGLNDASGNNHHLTSQGQIDCTLPGRIGASCEIPADGSSLQIVPYPFDQQESLGFTLAGWFKLDEVARQRHLWELGYSNFEGFISNGRFTCRLQDNQGNTIQVNSRGFTAQENVWYHIACTFDTGEHELTLFVNGIPVSTAVGNFNQFHNPPATGMGIGCRLANVCGSTSSGSILIVDDLYLYERSLTPDEIKDLVMLGQSTAPEITIDHSQTFQTFQGWEAMSFLGQISPYGVQYHADSEFGWRDEVIRRVVEDIGVNRIRLEIQSGSEKGPSTISRDYWDSYLTQPTQANFQAMSSGTPKMWYVIVNDNDDPDSIDWDAFYFTHLDYQIESMVLPLKQQLESRGESLYVNLNYVDFGNTPFEHFSDPDGNGGNPPECDEYAEFILATFQHMDQKYGFVPDGVEVILEPDHPNLYPDSGYRRDEWETTNSPPGQQHWTPERVACAIVSTAQRLEQQGYTPEFIAPSTTFYSNGVPYFRAMITAQPAVQQYLTEVSVHRYEEANVANAQQLATLNEQHGLRISQLEWWPPDHVKTNPRNYEQINGKDYFFIYEDLHEDLKHANMGAWQLGVISTVANPNPTRISSELLYVILTEQVDFWNPLSTPKGYTITEPKNTDYFQQYTKFIRPGAVRVQAMETSSNIDSLAFRNANGKWVVIALVKNPETFAISSLPAGTYGIQYTTRTESNIDLPDVSITNNEKIYTSIPAPGVITVYQK